jgi:hypothetical protein
MHIIFVIFVLIVVRIDDIVLPQLLVLLLLSGASIDLIYWNNVVACGTFPKFL